MKQTITINWAWVGVYVLLISILGFNVYATYSRGEPRSISVEGVSTIKAEPDSFVFHPQFAVKSVDQAEAKKLLAAKSREVIDKLKSLGLDDKAIKLDASQYDTYSIKGMPEPDRPQTQLSLTITAKDKSMAQKVQDYLASTDATGQLTPQPTFSEAKREQLQKEAETKAVANARDKADTLAKNLGAKRGQVITVDNAGEHPQAYPTMSLAQDSTARSSLPVQPGTNEFVYRITVKFALN